MIYLFIKQYYRSIIIGFIILWLSLSGSKSLIPGRMLSIPYVDKIGHFAMYSFFSTVLLLDSCRWHSTRHLRYIILLIPLFFGALMEILQMTLTTTRKAEMLDMMANITGVASGIVLAHIALNILKRFRSSNPDYS
jgi:VanZ family protein